MNESGFVPVTREITLCIRLFDFLINNASRMIMDRQIPSAKNVHSIYVIYSEKTNSYVEAPVKNICK